MEKSTVNWGILSTAEIARKQVIPSLHSANNAKAAAIASGSGKADEFAASFNIPKAYNSYEELLQDPDINVVYIPLPNSLHAKWVREAAKHGKHVLCEKPAALTAEETKEMIEVCSHHNVLFMEAYMYQFHPQHKRVKDIIASGEVGDVKLMHTRLSFMLHQLEGNIRMSRQLGGGSLFDLGGYCIHAIRNTLQQEPKSVFALEERYQDYDVDQSAVVMMELENGVKAYFDCSMNMAERHSYEVIGTKGKIEVTKAYVPQSDGEGVILVNTEDGRSRKEIIIENQYTLGVEHFSDCILTGTKPSYSTSSSINNMKALEACHQSIDSGLTVTI
ncbi:Gfo/Idh/MocA family protein [Alteribacillus sp. YIM 98480]|uniref:Gfo/Idh/MocA family protein n=1 Tax=Alteribacillus sp. YIM 98480 TaxID=2606599 RepID=UPI00131EA8B4|nr:Gfo/Idh/MocA family oxidoreductase [Alteribacillus sp. YIM 98480]